MAPPDLLQQALAGSQSRAASDPGARPAAAVVLAGAGGPLGAAVLEQLLGRTAWRSVIALACQPMGVAMAGLDVRPLPGLAARVDRRPGVRAGAAPALESSDALAGAAHTAVVVFDRERGRHGREAAFLQPDPAHLAELCRWLFGAGVRHLLLVLPHAPGLMPQALRAGLANLDEQAVAAQGFLHVLLVRPARAGAGSATEGDQPARAGDRLARALLAQLHWMVPQREQALRAGKLAELVAALAKGLPNAPGGTRVMPPEAIWDWAQPGGGAPWLSAWMAEAAVPAVAQPARRW